MEGNRKEEQERGKKKRKKKKVIRSNLALKRIASRS